MGYPNVFFFFNFFLHWQSTLILDSEPSPGVQKLSFRFFLIHDKYMHTDTSLWQSENKGMEGKLKSSEICKQLWIVCEWCDKNIVMMAKWRERGGETTKLVNIFEVSKIIFARE